MREQKQFGVEMCGIPVSETPWAIEARILSHGEQFIWLCACFWSSLFTKIVQNA